MSLKLPVVPVPGLHWVELPLPPHSKHALELGRVSRNADRSEPEDGEPSYLSEPEESDEEGT